LLHRLWYIITSSMPISLLVDFFHFLASRSCFTWNDSLRQYSSQDENHVRSVLSPRRRLLHWSKFWWRLGYWNEYYESWVGDWTCLNVKQAHPVEDSYHFQYHHAAHDFSPSKQAYTWATIPKQYCKVIRRKVEGLSEPKWLHRNRFDSCVVLSAFPFGWNSLSITLVQPRFMLVATSTRVLISTCH
jgi:hypothetical protein